MNIPTGSDIFTSYLYIFHPVAFVKHQHRVWLKSTLVCLVNRLKLPGLTFYIFHAQPIYTVLILPHSEIISTGEIKFRNAIDVKYLDEFTFLMIKYLKLFNLGYLQEFYGFIYVHILSIFANSSHFEERMGYKNACKIICTLPTHLKPT